MQMKANVFVDMDGVLAEQSHDLVKYMYDKNFFLTLPPVYSMINVVKKLIKSKKYNVYILSSFIDSPYTVIEKDLWLDKYLSEIPKNMRLFVPYGVNKASYVKSKMATENTINVLIDDFTVNLDGWQIDNALAIKVLNNINNTKGTWVNNGGLYINAYHDVDDNVVFLNNLITEKFIEIKYKIKGVDIDGSYEYSK